MRGKTFPNDHLDLFFNATVDAAIVLASFVHAAEAVAAAVRHHARGALSETALAAKIDAYDCRRAASRPCARHREFERFGTPGLLRLVRGQGAAIFQAATHPLRRLRRQVQARLSRSQNRL
jgi:hypothetical protein